MPRRSSELLPATAELLRAFGDRLRRARLRRELTAKQVAERAGMAIMTFRGVERGASSVTIASYLAVMQVLGLERDLALLAASDPVGNDLQDARLPRLAEQKPRERPPRPAKSPAPVSTNRDGSTFTSSTELAALLRKPKPKPKPKP